jgi:hypothetical protein
MWVANRRELNSHDMQSDVLWTSPHCGYGHNVYKRVQLLDSSVVGQVGTTVPPCINKPPVHNEVTSQQHQTRCRVAELSSMWFGKWELLCFLASVCHGSSEISSGRRPL